MVAAIAILKKTFKEAVKSSGELFRGEITVSKRDCWLVGIILVLTGIAIGLINAPLTHGVSISLCSNNGSNNGNNSGNGNGGNDANVNKKTAKDKAESVADDTENAKRSMVVNENNVKRRFGKRI